MLRVSRAEFSIFLLMFTLLFTVVALFNQSNRANDDVIERAFSSAEDLAGFVVVAQRHYIDSVSAIPVNELTSNPEKEPEKIWLPLTYAMRYTKAFSASNPGVEFRLYSADPFIFNRTRELDTFGQTALEVLLPGGVPDYRAVEELDDGFRMVRYAAAFRMDENCVACHNREEWGLQNQNWQVGDIRGAWETSLIVPPSNLYSQAEFYMLFSLVVASCFLAIFFVWPAVRSEVKSRSFFHARSLSMEAKAKQKALEANTDALTQIGNRRFFDTEFQTVVDTYARGDGTLSAIIFDIDHFKRVNDTYGHDVGDSVIKSVAELLRKNSRAKDKIARIGGEEFAILVPDLNTEEVLAIANRIKSELQEHVFSFDGQKFSVTISASVAHLRDNENSKDLWKRADALLYQAKEAGRNKICDTFGTPLQT